MNSNFANLMEDLGNNIIYGAEVKLEKYTVHSVDAEAFVIDEYCLSENEINIVSTTGRYLEIKTYYIEDLERFVEDDKVYYTYFLDGTEYTLIMDLVA